MDILSILGHVASIYSVLQLSSKAAQFIAYKRQDISLNNPSRLSKGKCEERTALKATLDEWERVAIRVEPRLKAELDKVKESDTLKRAELLASLANTYAKKPDASDRESLNGLKLKHSKLGLMEDGNIRVYFGQSDETRSLQGQAFNIKLGPDPVSNLKKQPSKGGDMSLPVFKVTMLGGSGSGKTVFMSAMYAVLREGPSGIAIRAISPKVNVTLDTIIQQIYSFSDWPPGNERSQINYDFEFQLNNKAICRIDWVDYRGGILLEALTEDNEEEVEALRNRLRQSHAIIWMIDMTKIQNSKIDSFASRLVTGVGNMAQLCRDAVDGNDDARAWIFVRTKADTVRGSNGMPDYNRACKELIEHLGTTADIARNRPNSRAAAVAVSATGRLKADGTVEGDNPCFVEWPLALSLAFLLEAKVSRHMKEDVDKLLEQYDKVRSGRIQVLWRHMLALGEKPQAAMVLNELDELVSQLYSIRTTFQDLMEKRPNIIKLLE